MRKRILALCLIIFLYACTQVQQEPTLMHKEPTEPVIEAPSEAEIKYHSRDIDLCARTMITCVAGPSNESWKRISVMMASAGMARNSVPA